MEQVLEYLTNFLSALPDSLGAAKELIEENFGMAGVIAAIILFVTIAALLVTKILKAGFNIFRYVVVPSVVITFIATYFLPYSFGYILPVTVSFFSVVLMVKG